MKAITVQTFGAPILLGGLLAAASWEPVTQWFAWRHDYGEAEPLVQSVWPMAQEIRRFVDEYGRPPTSFDELARFSPDHDFSPLRTYPHEFSSSGPRWFFLRVNSRFSFVIDEGFSPHWSPPTGPLGAPTNPQ